MPKVTAVATAAPVLATDIRNAVWKVAVAADAASSAGHRRAVRARTDAGSVARTAAASTSPPRRIRAPPRAAGSTAEPASTCAGPTVPQRIAADRTSRTPDR
jgi:hypothetical protein